MCSCAVRTDDDTYAPCLYSNSENFPSRRDSSDIKVSNFLRDYLSNLHHDDELTMELGG